MSLDATIQLSLGQLRLDVAIHAEAGELLAILGPNGAGKSTLLRCLAGLAPIDSGRITIDEVVVDDPSAAVFIEPAKRPVGMVFQDYLLFGHMTVLENVAFGLRARRVPKDAARATAQAWLERLGLGDHANDHPHVLSGGQAQRAALARAMATDPRLLLLDEPLAALDVATRAHVRRDLRHHLAGFDGIRLLVTHDPVDAYALADRVVIIDAGQVVQSGTLSEVTAHPRSRYVADLIGVNLVSGTVEGGVMRTDRGAHVVIADAQDGPSFAVIRPHSIVLQSGVPEGASVRNVWGGVVTDVDRLGDRVRIGIDGALPLTAEITAAALEALGLRSGDEVHASVKATDIEVYPA